MVTTSYVLHGLLNYHLRDYDRIPNEDAFVEAVERLGIPPGNYPVPLPRSRKERMGPPFMRKRERGPIWLNIMTPFSMRRVVLQWFVYSLAVGIFAALLAGRALAPGAEFSEVVLFAGLAAFGAHSFALWQRSVWYRTKWSRTVRSTFDGLVYGLETGAIFGWLWPDV